MFIRTHIDIYLCADGYVCILLAMRMSFHGLLKKHKGYQEV